MKTSRGAAAAATQIVRGDELRRRAATWKFVRDRRTPLGTPLASTTLSTSAFSRGDRASSTTRSASAATIAKPRARAPAPASARPRVDARATAAPPASPAIDASRVAPREESETGRGDAAAATWMFRGVAATPWIVRGDGSRTTKIGGRDVDVSWRVAATPWIVRGDGSRTTKIARSIETIVFRIGGAHDAIVGSRTTKIRGGKTRSIETTGYTGAQCGQCAPGFYGLSCQLCPPNTFSPGGVPRSDDACTDCPARCGTESAGHGPRAAESPRPGSVTAQVRQGRSRRSGPPLARCVTRARIEERMTTSAGCAGRSRRRGCG